MLIKVIKDLNKWQNITVFVNSKTQHSKSVNSSKLIYSFNTISIKIPERYFVIRLF